MISFKKKLIYCSNFFDFHNQNPHNFIKVDFQFHLPYYYHLNLKLQSFFASFPPEKSIKNLFLFVKDFLKILKISIQKFLII